MVSRSTDEFSLAMSRVSATTKLDIPDGSMRKLRGRLYSRRKSTACAPADFPELTRCRLTSCPDLVVIRALLRAGCEVVGLMKTSRGSASECSALKLAGLPITTELISSGNRTDVV